MYKHRRIPAAIALACMLGHACAVSAQPAPRYLTTRNPTNPQFFTSIERVGKCDIPGKPIASGALVIPHQLYPPNSLRDHEEGTVQLQLVFDAEWCVHKATIVTSSGYWRLDAVSLEFAIKLKWTPRDPVIIDGEPTTTMPIRWGASQAIKK